MAEPLLKRTFSRLRGNRARRKTTGGKSEAVTQNPPSSPSSPSLPSLPLTTSVRDSNPSPPRTHITVAKKQLWAKQASVGRGDPRDHPHTPPSSPEAPGPASRHPGWERGSGNAQAPSAGPAGNQQRSSHDKEEEPAERNPVGLEGSDQHVAPCLPSGGTAAPHEASTPTGDRGGAYLQSLDRSSRAWVLSSGKAQAPDQASASSRPQGEHNIWYNPIPEEDDSAASAARREEESVWKRRRDQEVGGATKSASDCPMRAPQRAPGGGATADCPIGAPQRGPGGGATAAGAGQKDRQGNDSPKGGASPNIRHRPPDDIITPEHTEPVQCEAPPPPDSSPSSQKKGGVSGSVIDRLRSPGTVRRLSLKMKKLPELRRKLSLRSHRHGNKEAAKDQSETTSSSSSSNQKEVISRYHLDSSAPPVRPLRKSSRGRSAGKGGYLSDGDSPELLPRQQQAPPPASMPGGGCDVTSFRLYVGSEQPRCAKRVTGLLTVHLMGLDHMMDRADRQVFVAIQIDGVTRARTALLPLRGSALSLNHAFHLELERARQLRLIVLTPTVCPQGLVGVTAPGTNQSHTSSSGSPAPSSCGPTRNRVCGLGGVCIPPLFKACRGQQLCVKLEPRGLLYIKLSLQEQWDTPTILPKCSGDASSSVFGVELHLLVEREGGASAVPILIQKTVEEIERRGLKVVGVYRLCGSAAVKKELRDWFERNSAAVSLSEELYPDINVVTGILKDYLRELPSPLITRTLYQVVLEAMTSRPPPNPVVTLTSDPELCRSTVSLLDCLPPPEKATLSLLLDHLSLVSSLSHVNRMTHQNLAVCFGPVLLWGGGANQPTSQSGGGGRGFDHGEGGVASAVDFKRHIEALHYLLQLWPVPVGRPTHRDDPLPSPPPSPPPPLITHNPLGQQRRAALRLALPPPEEAVVSRRGRGRPARLDSSPPINRYAGDWSVCGRDFLSGQEADYDEVAGSESEGGSDEDEEEEEQKKEGWTSYVDDFLDFDAPFSCRLSLKDFDALIHDLDRELLNICL